MYIILTKILIYVSHMCDAWSVVNDVWYNMIYNILNSLFSFDSIPKINPMIIQSNILPQRAKLDVSTSIITTMTQCTIGELFMMIC